MVSGGLDLSETNRRALTICMGYGSFIRKIIRQNLNDVDVADDIFQSLFLHLIVSPIPADTENIERYLYRTVINCIAENRRRDICYEAYIEEYSENAYIAQAEPAPETEIIAAEEMNKLFTSLLRHLTRRERKAITLRYLNDLSFDEIAAVMHIKAESVNSYISRGIKKLRSATEFGRACQILKRFHV